MDFYEELGLAPDASAEEIHRAYKRLAKQFHPDTRSTDVQRRWAETQMRRINEIFETLSDPGRKARYDETLRDLRLHEILDQQGFEEVLLRRRQNKAKWAVGGALAALLLIGGGLYFLVTSSDRRDGAAGHYEGPSAPAEVARAAPALPAKEEPAASPAPAPVTQADPVPLLKAAVPRTASDPIKPVVQASRQETASASAPRILAVPALPPPEELSPLRETPPPPPVGARPRVNTLAGTWIFSPSRAPRTNLPFAAEYVEVLLKVFDEHVTGRFQGRYNVRTTTLQPHVEFHFEGTTEDLTRGLPWRAENGANGLIKFHLLSENELEVGWYTTKFAAEPALTSGNAILARDPSEH